jgi:hypothetical protein
MKITFWQTGGFAGLNKVAEINSEQLSDQECELLSLLVNQSTFFEIPEPVQQVRPDEEQYAITIESSGRSRTLHVGRSQLPDQIKPLIEYVAKRAVYQHQK